VTGIADFVFAPQEGRNLAVSLETLRAMAGAPAGAASLVLVRVRPGADPYAVAHDFRARTADADVFAIPEIIEAAGGRLTYFRQLSLVLGVVSLGVTFLLVTTLLTLSVNDRWGEIATLRALGVTRPHLLAQVALQGLLLCAAGALTGVGVGWIVSRYLDMLLRAFPGLPAGVSFFVFTARDAAVCAALVLATGLAAGLYPAWRAASVEIAGTLRAEAA
jgi:putative ABC transport system permease protein